MKLRRMAVFTLLLMLAAAQALAQDFPGWPFADGPRDGSSSFFFPGNGNAHDGQRQIGDPQVTETKLMSQLSARSVAAGGALYVLYDLQLAAADYDRVSVIEQGTTLEYQLLRVSEGAGEEARPEEVLLSGSETFSMKREENERCMLTLQPETAETCAMKIRAVMKFSDGTELENESDTFLVYTEEDILTHLSAQECAPGDELQMDVMVRGPEGIYTFQIYCAVSTDQGRTYARKGDPMDVFVLDSHSQQPDTRRTLRAEADGDCLIQYELVVQTPELKTLHVFSDPVRIRTGQGDVQSL